MKKILLFIIGFWQFNNVVGQTSIYHPFPADNAVWNVSLEDYWNYDCRKYSYSIIGDTVINSTSYHKIGEQGQSFLMQQGYQYPPYVICTNQVIGTFSFYRGAIREDAVQKRVYFFDALDSTEYLLYDFTLNAGDTIKGYLDRYLSIVIKSIDSTLIGTNYRKTWTIDPGCGWGGPTPKIIEGIGSIFGLLELPCGIEKNIRSLDCFSYKNQTLYPIYNATGSCALITSINDKKLEHTLSISPNPSNGKFQIVMENDNLNNIEITDILGEKIYRAELKNKTLEIDLSAAMPGIYFVRINDKGGNSVVKKIIKE